MNWPPKQDQLALTGQRDGAHAFEAVFPCTTGFRQRACKRSFGFGKGGAERAGRQKRKDQTDCSFHVFLLLRFNDVEVQLRRGHAFAQGGKQRILAAFERHELFDVLLIAVCNGQYARANGRKRQIGAFFGRAPVIQQHAVVELQQVIVVALELEMNGKAPVRQLFRVQHDAHVIQHRLRVHALRGGAHADAAGLGVVLRAAAQFKRGDQIDVSPCA